MFASGVPSRLFLLPDLDTAQHGDKVRFLGCVEAYDVKSATLTLGYSYQTRQPRQNDRYYAEVDISQLLENFKSTDLQVGAWINVVGYIAETRSPVLGNKKKVPTDKDKPNPCVQAVMLRNAEEIRLDQYELAVKMRNST